jgi:hypothetical protein
MPGGGGGRWGGGRRKESSVLLSENCFQITNIWAFIPRTFESQSTNINNPLQSFWKNRQTTSRRKFSMKKRLSAMLYSMIIFALPYPLFSAFDHTNNSSVWQATRLAGTSTTTCWRSPAWSNSSPVTATSTPST